MDVNRRGILSIVKEKTFILRAVYTRLYSRGILRPAINLWMVKSFMEVDEEKFNQVREKAKKLYEVAGKIPCPYFGFDVILNSDGFHHLQFSARRERNKEEQLLKFRLLPLALKIIKKSGTVQEMRSDLRPLGKKGKDGFIPMKTVSYWAFIAIIGEESKVKIKTILRKVGDGNVIFWSVMPYSKLKNDQKLYSGDIEDE